MIIYCNVRVYGIVSFYLNESPFTVGASFVVKNKIKLVIVQKIYNTFTNKTINPPPT